MFIKLLVAAIAALSTLAVAAPDAIFCNGHVELCDRRYSNLTFIGAHDSPFVGDDMADNQNITISEQLAMGVRFLQGQTHDKEGTIEMCHTNCDMRDAGSLEEMLVLIKTFLDANPTEIITLLLTNPDAFTGSDFDAVFKSVGLDAYAFAPERKLEADQWPTLREMIDKGRRLVVFMDYLVHDPVHYIIDEFNKTIIYASLLDLSYCSINRPAGAGPDDGMLLMNHWLQANLSGILIPDRCMAIVTNSQEYIKRHVDSCQRTFSKTPTLILQRANRISTSLFILQDVKTIQT
ncbi:hypothetical protein N0V82_003327 [Gnomoniopsis sp. IMI 355080]|nr:hypothetical protein N0V82_003327 [Gnomoniopsis sp. IMI 355080]